MPATLLSVIQDHCRRHALAVPTSVTGSTDTTIIQLFQILKDVCSEVVTQSKFNVTTQIATFVLTATADQGAMTTIAPNGYQFAIFETFFDRTLRRALYGPVTETEWEQLLAMPSDGTFYKFRIMNDHLFLNPVPVAPFSTIAFEYMSSWYTKNNAGALKEVPTADNDTFLFPDNLLKRGLAYQWKQGKGLPYQADEKTFWDLLNNYIAKDKVKRRIDVSCPTPVDLQPGIFVPSNTWPV